VVVSLWAGGLCRGSFRLPSDDLDRLISVLVEMKWTKPAAPDAGPPAPLSGVA
jgi:hypothetical protein